MNEQTPTPFASAYFPAQVAARLLATRSSYEAVGVLVEALGWKVDGAADVLHVLHNPEAHGLSAAQAQSRLSGLCQLVEAIAGERDPAIPTDVYGEIGSVYRQRRQPERAREFYERALENARNAQDRAACLNSLAILAIEAGDLQTAAAQLKRARSICEQNHVGGLILANILLNLSNVASDAERLQWLEGVVKAAGSEAPAVATKARLALARIAFEKGDLATVREQLDSVARSPFSPADATSYHWLRSQCFAVDPAKTQLLDQLDAAIRTIVRDTGDVHRLEELLSGSRVPLSVVGERIESLLDPTDQGRESGIAVAACLREVALQQCDPAALTVATFLLTKVFSAGEPAQRIEWLEQALHAVTGSGWDFLRFRLLVTLADEHIKRAPADPEHELHAAVVAWQAARAVAPSPPDTDVESRAMLAECHVRFAGAYAQLVALGELEHSSSVIENLEAAAALVPPGGEFKALREHIANNLANARIRQAPLATGKRLPLLVRAAEARRQLLKEGLNDPVERCQLLLNIAQDCRELAAAGPEPDRANHLDAARSYAAQASAVLASMDAGPPALKLAVAAVNVEVALDREAAADELVAYARQLDSLLPLASLALDNAPVIAAAYSAAVRAAGRLGLRARIYRRWLQALRLLRPVRPFDPIVRHILRRLVEHMLDWGHPARAVFFLSLIDATTDEEPRVVPQRRHWRAADGEALVLWYLGEQSWNIVIDSGGVRARPITTSRAQALDFSRRWLNMLIDSGDIPAEDESAAAIWHNAMGTLGGALGGSFFTSIADWLPSNGTLYLLPPPEMRVLPLHLAALPTNRGSPCHLLDRLSVAYARRLSFRPAPSPRPAAPPFVASYSPPHARLPFSVLEAVAIAGIYRGAATIAINEEATQKAVINGVRSSAIVHLSCHGVFDLKVPLNSALHFADSAVTLREMNLALSQCACRVIVLSACETGTDAGLAPDDVGGFPGLLLRLGCREVIAARWRVDDVATCLQMASLHRQLFDGQPPAVALATAQAWLRTRSGAQLANVLRSSLGAAVRWLAPKEIEYIESRIRALQDQNESRPFAHPQYWGAFATTADTVAVHGGVAQERVRPVPSGEGKLESSMIRCPHCGARTDSRVFGLERLAELHMDGARLHCPYCSQAFFYSVATRTISTGRT
jgi:tetratricopeptide (TPR) repeat protein